MVHVVLIKTKQKSTSARTYMYSTTSSLLGTGSDHGGVTNHECGSNYSVPQGKGLSFFCRPPLHGRYVTIRSLRMNDALTLCEVEVYSERRGTLHNFYVDTNDNLIMVALMI